MAALALWGAPDVLHARYGSAPPLALTLRMALDTRGAYYELRDVCEPAEGVTSMNTAERAIYVSRENHRTHGAAAADACAHDYAACIDRVIGVLQGAHDGRQRTVHLLDNLTEIMRAAGIPQIRAGRNSYNIAPPADGSVDTRSLLLAYTQFAHLLEDAGVAHEDIRAVKCAPEEFAETASSPENSPARGNGMLLLFSAKGARLYIARPEVIAGARTHVKKLGKQTGTGESWIHDGIGGRWTHVDQKTEGVTVVGEHWRVDNSHLTILDEAANKFAYTTYDLHAERAAQHAWETYIAQHNLLRSITCEVVAAKAGGNGAAPLEMHLRVPVRVLYLVTTGE
jgi:hypothetical protein